MAAAALLGVGVLLLVGQYRACLYGLMAVAAAPAAGWRRRTALGLDGGLRRPSAWRRRSSCPQPPTHSSHQNTTLNNTTNTPTTPKHQPNSSAADRRRFKLGLGQHAELRRYAPMLIAEVEVDGTLKVWMGLDWTGFGVGLDESGSARGFSCWLDARGGHGWWLFAVVGALLTPRQNPN